MRKSNKQLETITITTKKRRFVFSAILFVFLMTVLLVNISAYQDVRVMSMMGTRAERTGNIYGTPLVQRFVPSGNRIEYIELHLSNCDTMDGSIVFTIENKKGTEIYREEIPMTELSSDQYVSFNIRKDVRKGSTYYFKVLATGMRAQEAPKLWLSNNIKDEIRDVIFENQPEDRRLQTNTEIGYAQFHYGAFSLSLVCIVLTCGTILITLKLSEKTRKKICFVILFTMPLVMFILAEQLNNQSAFTKSLAPFVVNYILYLIIYAVFFSITNRLRFTILFGNIWIFVIALVNYYKLEFRGEPFVLNDIVQFQTMMNVSSEYQLKLRYMVLTMGLAFMLVTAIVSRFRYQIKDIRYRIALSAISVIAASSIIIMLFDTDRYSASTKSFMQKIGIINNVWNQPKNFTDNGMIVAITMNAKYLTVEPPDVYNLPNLADVLDDVGANYGMDMITDLPMTENQRTNDFTGTRPNIICIMDESYSDFSQFEGLELTKDYSPFLDSLYEDDNAIRGDLYVSTYGGGTANSEFEFLTGNSMLGMPQGSIPYQQYIEGTSASISSILRNSGYRTIALHPYLGSGWNRPSVYEYMGFDEFYHIDHFPDAEYIRSYVSDDCSFDRIIELYESNEEEEGSPLFIFNVTMQNHGGYTKTYSNFEPDVFVSEQPGEFPQAEQYFSVARETDVAIEELVNYFREVDEPTVICFFGDHMPSLKDGFYESMLGVSDTSQLTDEEMQSLYTTDYFIWANYPISTSDNVQNISLNYMSTLLFQSAGLPLSGYQMFLSTLYEAYPSITSMAMFDRAGNYLGSSSQIMSTDVWNYYSVLMYNNVFDNEHRVGWFFDYPFASGIELMDEDESGVPYNEDIIVPTGVPREERTDDESEDD